MPRIRKKTSKRGTTHQREKIKHKVTETRRKRKKESKKNPQWKSKHKKDPGIPNNFPYKDQILAEVAEARRQAEELKQRKKELKKAAAAEEVEGSDDEGSVHYDGTTTMHLANGGNSRDEEMAPSAEGEEAPTLFSHEWPNLKSLLDGADVVIEVLDARDPLAGRSEYLEKIVREKQGQKLLLVLNKIDTCPREAIAAWASSLRSIHPTFLFRSSSSFLPSSESSTYAKGKGKERADDAWGMESVTLTLSQCASEKGDDKPLVVAVVGVTNAGKSSLINSLVGKAALPVYKLSSVQDGPSTTTHAQEVILEVSGKKIRLVDTPGLSWVQPENATPSDRSRDILTRNKGRIERLKDPEPVVAEVVSRSSKEDLMLFYNLPAFADKDVNAFLSALARPNGLVKKGGVLDLVGASRIVLRDWSTGKFPRYTVPGVPVDSLMAVDTPMAKLYDDQVLAKLFTRKELRKTTGLVKLIPSDMDQRHVQLEAPWVSSEESDSEGGEDEVENGGEDEECVPEGEESEDGDDSEDSGATDEGEDSDEQSDDEGEDEETPPPSKRKRAPVASEPSVRPKKVAFSAEPKNTKQARSKAGANGSTIARARKAGDPLKSALKSKPVTRKPAAPQRIANASSLKRSPPSAQTGEEVYDFKKFF